MWKIFLVLLLLGCKSENYDYEFIFHPGDIVPDNSVFGSYIEFPFSIEARKGEEIAVLLSKNGPGIVYRPGFDGEVQGAAFPRELAMFFQLVL